MSELVNPDSTATRDYGKWAVGILILAVLSSEVFLYRQNRALRADVQAETARAQRITADLERSAAETAAIGGCQPILSALSPAAAPHYDIAVYFSLERDCLTCARDVVSQVNDALRAPGGASLFRARGYTNIDGVTKQQFLDRELAPAFPVQHVAYIEDQLPAKGVSRTPVAFVSDASTGRVLFSYVGTTLSTRPFVKRLQTLAAPCS